MDNATHALLFIYTIRTHRYNVYATKRLYYSQSRYTKKPQAWRPDNNSTTRVCVAKGPLISIEIRTPAYLQSISDQRRTKKETRTQILILKQSNTTATKTHTGQYPAPSTDTFTCTNQRLFSLSTNGSNSRQKDSKGLWTFFYFILKTMMMLAKKNPAKNIL